MNCERCGTGDPIIVHHKDRNRSNNNPMNLEVLCPNCHYKEHGMGTPDTIERRYGNASVLRGYELRHMEKKGLIRLDLDGSVWRWPWERGAWVHESKLRYMNDFFSTRTDECVVFEMVPDDVLTWLKDGSIEEG